MSTLNNITSYFVQTVSSASKSILSETWQKYGKITAVALAIIGAAVASYFIFKRYAGFKEAQTKQDIPSSIVPNPPVVTKPPVQVPTVTISQPINPFAPQPPPLPPQRSRTLPPENRCELPRQVPVNDIADQPSEALHNRETSAQSDDWDLAYQAIEDADQLESEKAPVEVPPVLPSQLATKQIPKTPFSDQVDVILTEVSSNVLINKTYSTVKAFSAISRQTSEQIKELLDEVIVEFERRYPPYQRIGYGEMVPEYFANVKAGSDQSRKYLSLVGIRNLLKAGPGIVDDFARQNFIGGEHHYSDNCGLNAFKYYTGNLVDLDTELLNPSRKIALSPQQALAQANDLIIAFGTKLGLRAPQGGNLTAEEVGRQLPNRKLHLPGPYGQVPYASSNKDRSNHGLWMRKDPDTGELKYFVNVPDCQVVLGATLRLPYVIAELIWRAKESNGGKLAKDFLDDFFNRGVSDKCFNDKFGRFMSFYLEWTAKFDSEETPEETARSKVKSGAFGEIIQALGPDAAITSAYTRIKLINLVDANLTVDINGRDFNQWVGDETDKIIAYLKKIGHWEKRLYRSEGKNDKNPTGSDYFLLDRTTLKEFLKEYFIYLQTQ